MQNAVGTEESIASTQEFREAFSQLQQVEMDWKTDGN